MLQLTARTHYGVAALLELAGQPPGALLQLKAIAARRHIPTKFLEQILGGLCRAGLVKAVRGNHGGYELARPASQIVLAEVVGVLEGTRSERAAVPEGVFGELVREAEARIAEVFHVSVGDLLERELARSGAMFHI